jgi:osmotically inducible protein OsmC
MPIRRAEALWEGTLREGKGRTKVSSGAFEGPYSFSTRFEEEPGTNPEELIGAAHASCFSMAFGAQLERAGFPANSIHTTANVHLDKQEAGGFKITRIHLVTEAEVPNIDQATFNEKAEAAKAGCPVSQVLTGAEITLDAKLVGQQTKKWW